MKDAKYCNELTQNKYLFKVLTYENEHKELFNRIEAVIMKAVEDNHYIASIELPALNADDIKMISRVLQHYGFQFEWVPPTNEDPIIRQPYTLTIHWA